jgi:hypothetical protein
MSHAVLTVLCNGHNLNQHLLCRRCRSCRSGSPSPRRRSTGEAWRRSSSRSDPGSAWTAASTGGSWTGMSGLWPMSFKETVGFILHSFTFSHVCQTFRFLYILGIELATCWAVHSCIFLFLIWFSSFFIFLFFFN